MWIAHFLLLLGPLVFFHELGHFLVARWMGVRVLSFSIGFGPVVFAWQRNGTEYAIRAFPLGGFVKMLGDDPTSADEPDERTAFRSGEVQQLPPPPDSFAVKPVWRRTLIVAAGPIANFLLPIAILFSGSMITDGDVISSRVGTVLPGGPADRAGLRSGDRITKVDGVAIESFMDLRREISARPGSKSTVEFERRGRTRSVPLTPKATRDVRLPELGIVNTVGRIQVLPDGQSAIITVKPGSPAYAAGLRTGWRVKRVNKHKTARFYELSAALAGTKAGSVALTVVPITDVAPAPRKQLLQARQKLHAGQEKVVSLSLTAGRDPAVLGITAAQTVVGVIEKGSPADLDLKLRPGDEITAVDGKAVHSYFQLLDNLRKPYDDARALPANRGRDADEMLVILRNALSKKRKVTVRRGSDVRSAELKLVVKLDKNDRPRLTFGASSVQGYEAPERIANTRRIGYAVERTVEEMTEAITITTLTVAGLFRGHVPVKEVGGPLFMAQLAARTAELGWGYFFKLMVWLSINLAILNLLPIPLVDGGHLLFLAVEAVKRKPVSLRTRMVASYIGMSFIGLLFVVVMKNDVQRLITAWTGG
jgi:regulator of sigma E protease